jgi:chromate transporter
LSRPPANPNPETLREIASLFFRLGATAFGGPAAHIAIMHDEVVQRRKWIDDQHFLDLLGATSLIPGPSSTEMTIHLGYTRGGWRGLILAGTCFIFPAALIVLILAWLYVTYGDLPAANWLLYAVKPVVIAVVLQALWVLGRKAVKGVGLGLIGAMVMALYFLGVNEILLIVLGGVAATLWLNRHRLTEAHLSLGASGLLGLFGGAKVGLGLGASLLNTAGVNLLTLFLTFLKIGSVLYGSGYVLLAFLRSDLVLELGWLTDQQLIDAIAIGQVTPGPVFTTATFIGYVLAGFAGAGLATLGIFLPSFIFVALSNPLIPKIRQSVWASGFLDGVNAASLGLMAAVTWQLGRASIIDPLTIGLAVVSAVLLMRYKINSTWLIFGAAAIGLLTSGGQF